MFTGIIEEIKSRRTGKREHEYEVIWEGQGREDSWHTRTEILQMGYKKLLDEKECRDDLLIIRLMP